MALAYSIPRWIPQWNPDSPVGDDHHYRYRHHYPKGLTMPNTKNTFPTLTVSERQEFDLYLESMTRVPRPTLVDYFLGGLNDAPIVSKVGNDAWKEIHATEASVYVDESKRTRKPGASQVETVRGYLKRIFAAYEEAFGTPYPAKDAFKVFDGKVTDTVDIWRTR